MRILVTGGTGFIGTNLLRKLCADGHEVHCMVRPASSNQWRIEDLGDKITVHHGDLTERSQVIDIFRQTRPQRLFHLAVSRNGADDFDGLFDGIIGATANLIAACRQYPPSRVIVLGSSLEYGHRPLPLQEDMQPHPSTIFGTAKLCSTYLFLQGWRSFALPVVILRVFSVYGPFESAKRLVPTALLAGIYGRTIKLTGPGIRRDYIHVDDVVQAAVIAAEHFEIEGEIINIGSGRQTSNEEVVTLIDQLTGNNLVISAETYPKHHTDTGHWVADTEKSSRLLGWKPAHDLHSGLAVTLNWLRQNLDSEEYGT
ncbi:NAD-dependent epimerase/dehydratase family protein [Desulforhopalus singaporensis]|uniref:NAD dependent epimerase/dehydratase family protein n=1 Tax=Desulforhopalus singaporensis TaxID=91360 RepID=A0A1H0LG85_9BACT|nr:NAD-dependent epimerase/dehydratase family protein [Desulforhopalus singaporensis]SDO67021.1 NAD dependent epimerase/dehydratase family protein [Desulforhopalus singaporensis]